MAATTAENKSLNIKSQEQLKALILSFVKDDSAFVEALHQALKTKKAKKTPKPKLVTPQENIPFSEMPFWKMNTNINPWDGKKYAISKEALKKIQEEWRDMPPAEDIIAQLTK